MYEILQEIRQKAAKEHKTIVLPEGQEPRVLEAACAIVKEKIAELIIIGDEKTILGNYPDLKGKAKIYGFDSKEGNDAVEVFTDLRKHKGMTPELAREEIKKNPAYMAAILVRKDLAWGFVGGAGLSTASIARAGIYCIGPSKESQGTICSSFLMATPITEYGVKGSIFFADCGILPDPSPKQLARIAILTGRLFRDLTQKKPKIAMLSYSTKGSAESPMIQKVKEATALALELAKGQDMDIDGELQVDAALVPEVAKRKLSDSTVAGQANVLIFPDLNSGNIAYKLVQRFTRGKAIGPLFQGLQRPCSDLSRGCDADEIIDAVAITAVRKS